MALNTAKLSNLHHPTNSLASYAACLLGNNRFFLQTIPPSLALWSCNHVGSLRADSFKTSNGKPTTAVALSFWGREEFALVTHDFCRAGFGGERFG